MNINDHRGSLAHKDKWYTIIDGVWQKTDIPYPGSGNKQKLNNSKKEAEKILIERLTALAPNQQPTKMTLDALAKAWLKTVKPTIRTNTYMRYTYSANKIIDYFGANVKVTAITRADAKRFFSFLLEKGKKNQKTGKPEPMAPASVRYSKLVLSLMLEYAIDAGVITHNPTRGITISGAKSTNRDKYMTSSQAQDFINMVQGDVLQDIITMALMYGLRREELLGLSINDLNRTKKTLHIHRTVTADTGMQELTKTESSNRYIPLTDEDVRYIESIIKKKQKNRAYFGNTYIDSDVLLVRDDGVQFRPDFVYHHTKNLFRKFGLSELTFHSLRHTFASIQYENGTPLLETQRIMGHADSATTLRIYTSIAKKELEAKPTGLKPGTTKERGDF